MLLERSLPLALKTIVMKTNKHEFMDLFHFAENRGVPFRWDTNINPNLDHSLTPCKVRLSPEEAAGINLSVPRRVEEIRNLYEPRRDFCTSDLFACGAGSRVYHIDPYGNMAMCLLLREPRFSLRDMPFSQIWNEKFPPLCSQVRRKGHPCNRCTVVSLCGKCPGWSLLEKGDIEAQVEWGCELGHRLAEGLGFHDGPAARYSFAECEKKEIDMPLVQIERPDFKQEVNAK